MCSLSCPAVSPEPELPVVINKYETPLPLPPIQLPCEIVPFPTVTPEPDLEEWFRYYDHIPFEYEMQKLVWEACEETGCSYELALAVISRESTYKNVNGDNGDSIGYMQIQPRWHYERMERLGVTDLTDTLSNFRVGCDLLTELIDKYGSVESALTCYNTGRPGTSNYANGVLAYMNETFFADKAECE